MVPVHAIDYNEGSLMEQSPVVLTVPETLMAIGAGVKDTAHLSQSGHLDYQAAVKILIHNNLEEMDTFRVKIQENPSHCCQCTL